ncbi:5-methyltetrahydropteroyltriglutamate--homocysteine S-methyltransferase [Flavihumibacter sp. CACIAM 22H1]|uniref:5-methyltetrahydropteroyltriglutamate-- homocysteine S-methyltransferase n=1 Tax=Flavihumibacter sp. CACIAM 22H1 TaxID=1812911 RepID=UPI0007A8611E|nr:5-methyltetrahydropteroyltriglutamate--homocysteine S-methyltransferase [Flavihumibacter sp. CACIAM 22H1]KYP15193.1 MAG: 5-methyltetrahydropteroyltriglutamate--homocysteine S-methyltransferase [Flavihumibacter sp. CACIAM 22H1]
MQTQNLGYPRIGNQRELKKATEQYWAAKISAQDLLQTGAKIRLQNWQLQKEAGIDLIPCNDFSFYDQVLDTCIMLGAIPERYHALMQAQQLPVIDLLFAMARGYQRDGFDLTAMEMTKWFDTNYHYLVPEFTANQQFLLYHNKVVKEFEEAKHAGFTCKPVVLGPVSFLLLGKEKEEGFHRLELIDRLLPVYLEMLASLEAAGAYYVQIDEPCLSLDLSKAERDIFTKVYRSFKEKLPHLKLILTSYFECYGNNLATVLDLPVAALHLDLVRCPAQLDDILATSFFRSSKILSLGLVDGRNIWINNYSNSLELIDKAIKRLGKERVWIAPSCSLLHVPCDLSLETKIDPELKQWMAFAKQKLEELNTLKQLADSKEIDKLEANKKSWQQRKDSARIHNQAVLERMLLVTAVDAQRAQPFSRRRTRQRKTLGLPNFPTTTIGSFPQTKEVRNWRAQWKKKELSDEQYETLLKAETRKAVQWQEEIGLDVLVHGEFERNDMVEYFGEQLAGFAFTENGWVQSYGSRCVKPPIIYGDVFRPKPMTVYWSTYAQSLTKRWMKGMLTGPVTILQWSFVRDDQPRSATCMQIALAIRDEVLDLENAGIKIIQIDEPALREGLPLRKENWTAYLNWAVRAFRIASSVVEDTTQIHTHMCYSEFNDIIEHIAAMDADVITIECSRSQMELLDAFAAFNYPNEIGPGVYDIHSPRVPDKEEMIELLRKASEVVSADQLWVNPDCGLKTRHWEETRKSLIAMVEAARQLRKAPKVFI